MQMRILGPRTSRVATLLVVLASAMGAACTPIAGPVVVEALVGDPEAENGVRLDDVQIETVVDLRTGEGELFDARGGLRMAGLTVTDSAKAGDSFQEMRDESRGDGGKDMNPRMSFDGERYVAEDLTTLTYFTVFDQFEEAWQFAEELGDDSGATNDKALIGIDATVVAADLIPLPILTSDNAAYAAPLDAWLTLRVATQDGIPFAMAAPVLAHELHHRVFHRNVFDDEDAFALWRKRVVDQTDEEAKATRILQGVDEGLADLFSLGHTGDVDGLRRTFALAGGRFVPEAERRDLEGDFADAATYQALATNTLDSSFLQACNSSGTNDLYAEDGFNFYCIGTIVARALWDGSGRDIEVLRGDVLPAVNRALSDVGDTLVGGTLFDVDVFLEPFVRELPPGARRDEVCARLAERFAEIVDAGRIPSCQ